MVNEVKFLWVIKGYCFGVPEAVSVITEFGTWQDQQLKESESGPVAKRTKCLGKWHPEWKRYGMKESKKKCLVCPHHCGVCIGFSVTSGGVHDVKHRYESSKT